MTGANFLIKHELRTARVKSLCFHSQRPWLLVGLHTGVAQIVDIRTGSVIERYEDHNGAPIRGVDFHPTQPVFATGCDDTRVRIWNFKLRRCTGVLLGHIDFVRSVQFHKTQPWLVSASDDMTVRIWNWEKRVQVTELRGHMHYVMCARFHPEKPIVVTCGSDNQVNVWDIAGIEFKTPEEAMPDMFATHDIGAKTPLDNHEGSVNSVAFHPRRAFFVSGSDDRTIRIWRLDEVSVAYEFDVLRAHSNNISAVMYCNDNTIISASEDKSIQVWDANNRTSLYKYTRNDRFWALSMHPTQNLIAAGHETGVMIFKLERERPAMCMSQNNKALLYVHDRHLHKYEFATGTVQSMCTLKRNSVPAHSISANSADGTVLASYECEGGLYEQFTMPSVPFSGEVDVRRGFFSSPVFVGPNKYAMLDKNRQITVRMTTNDQQKAYPAFKNTDRLFPGPQGFVICRAENSVALYDVSQKAAVAELPVSGVKYVVWDSNFQKVAFLSKNHITVATRRLKVITTLQDSSRIKSVCFDDSLGVVLYTTHVHLKYCLLQSGETGTLRTLDRVIYLVRANNDQMWYLDREGRVTDTRFDNTELTFKLALQQERYRDVLKLIKAQKVHGQALVAYLHKHAHPEIAMHFAEDQDAKFHLAVECGLLDDALEAAKALNTADCWRSLATAAMKAGRLQLSQLANAKMKNLTSLGVQCAIIGNQAAVGEILERAKDDNVKLQLSYFAGDAGTRATVLMNAGQLPLAYLTAKNEGHTELADEILSRMNPEVAARVQSEPSQPLPELEEGEPCDDDWPQLPVEDSYFTRMLKADGEFDMKADDGAATGNAGGAQWGDEGDDDLFDDAAAADDEETANAPGAATSATAATDAKGDWVDSDLDLDDDDVPPVGSASAVSTSVVVPRGQDSAGRHWVDQTQLPAAHIAAGSFISAVHLLQRQVGLINAEPLKPYFTQLWLSANAALPSAAGLPTQIAQLATRPAADAGPRVKHVPLLPRQLAVLAERLQQGYTETTEARFVDAQRSFTAVLHQALLVVVDSKEEEAELRKLVSIAKEYVGALSVEMLRRETTDNQQRAVELAAYFTHFKLQPDHLILALNQAMTLAFKSKNFKTAAALARRMLALEPSQERADRAKKVIAKCEQNLEDAMKLDYDERNPFVLCSVTKTPMYRGSVEPIRCPYCGSSAHPSHRGSLCPICQLAALGTDAAGMVNRAG